MNFPGALVLSVARLIGEDGISWADFQTSSGLKRQFGFGAQDHSRALAFMLSEGMVIQNGDRYYRGSLNLDPWVIQGIESGDLALEELSSLPGFRGRRKFQDGIAREIGLKGELFVMSLLQGKLDPDHIHRIDHVSLKDDAAGYDIRTPSVTGVWEEVFLEVKTTTRREGGQTFFLTRNEAKVGAKTPHWFLVFVQLTSLGPELLGYLPAREIEPLLPENRPGGFSWSEVSGGIPTENLFAGLP